MKFAQKSVFSKEFEVSKHENFVALWRQPWFRLG